MFFNAILNFMGGILASYDYDEQQKNTRTTRLKNGTLWGLKGEN